MPKTFLNQSLDDALGSAEIKSAGGESVTTRNNFGTCDGCEGDSFGIPRLKADCCACRDVEALSIRQRSIEAQSWIRFDEVVMRTDLL